MSAQQVPMKEMSDLQKRFQAIDIPQLPPETIAGNFVEVLPTLLAAIADIQGGSEVATPLINKIQTGKREKSQENVERQMLQANLLKSKMDALARQIGLEDELASRKLEREQSIRKEKREQGSYETLQKKYVQEMEHEQARFDEWEEFKPQREQSVILGLKQQQMDYRHAMENHKYTKVIQQLEIESLKREKALSKILDPIAKEKAHIEIRMLRAEEEDYKRRREIEIKNEIRETMLNQGYLDLAAEYKEQGDTLGYVAALRGAIPELMENSKDLDDVEKFAKLRKHPVVAKMGKDFNEEDTDAIAISIAEDLYPEILGLSPKSASAAALGIDTTKSILSLKNWWKSETKWGQQGIPLFDSEGYIHEKAKDRYIRHIKVLMDRHFDTNLGKQFEGDFEPGEEMFWLEEASSHIRDMDPNVFFDTIMGVEKPEIPKLTKQGKKASREASKRVRRIKQPNIAERGIETFQRFKRFLEENKKKHETGELPFYSHW